MLYKYRWFLRWIKEIKHNKFIPAILHASYYFLHVQPVRTMSLVATQRKEVQRLVMQYKPASKKGAISLELKLHGRTSHCSVSATSKH